MVKTTMNHKKRGFTALELMICVVIIGILAAIGIPALQTQRNRQRTNQAKQHLADIYSAEQAFRIQFRTYATCLAVMGVSQDANTLYGYGFALATQRAGPANSNCTDANNQGYSYFVANDTSLGDIDSNAQRGALIPPTPPPAAPTPTTNIGAATFRAGAVGNITTNNSPLDIWTIDENQQLNNTQRGF